MSDASTARHGTGVDVTPAGRTLTVAAFAVLAVVVPMTVVDWGRNAASLTNVLLGMLIVVVSAARLASSIGSGRPDLLRGFFHLFVYVFLGIAALAQLVAGRYPQDSRSYLDDTVQAGLLLTLVGVAAYEVGWAVYRRVRRGAGVAGPPARRWYVARGRVVAVGLVALAATAYQVSQHGIASFFLSRSETTSLLTGAEAGARFYQSDDKTAGLITIFVTQVPLFVTLFLVLYCRHHRLWPVPRTLVTDGAWRLFTLALVVGNVIINNPIGNARFWSALIVVAIISVYMPYRRTAAVRAFLLLALGILLLVFAALDAFRYTNKTDFSLSGPGTSLVTDPTYGMFQMMLNGLEYVSARGHTDGKQVLGALLNVVPRAWWEGKPIPTGQLVDPQYARAATLWTEFHVDLGLLGVMLGFLVVGLGSAALTRRAAVAVPGVLHALFPVLAVLQIFLLRGSLMPAASQLYQLAFVVVLLVGFVSLPRPGPPPAAGAGEPAVAGRARTLRAGS